MASTSDHRPEYCGLELHQIFDLKGSTVNREEPLTPEQVQYGIDPYSCAEKVKVPCMKDLNLLSEPRNLIMLPSDDMKRRIMDIIQVRSFVESPLSVPHPARTGNELKIYRALGM